MKHKSLSDVGADRTIVGAVKDATVYSLLELTDTMVDDTLEWIHVDSEIGHRIYEKSLVMLFIAAVKAVYPKSSVTVEHTINTGLYCRIMDRSFPVVKMEHIEKVKNKMRDMVVQDIPFELISAETEKEVLQMFKREELIEKEDIYSRIKSKTIVKLTDKAIDFGIFKTVPSTRYLHVFDLQYYPPGVIIRLPDIKNHSQLAEFSERKKLFRIHQDFKQWTEFNDMEYISSLNDKIESGEFLEMILISEGMHEKNISSIAQNIKQNIDHSRLILIAGPSSSGKTTFSKRLAIQLRVEGLVPVTIGMDDYFLPKAKTPLNEKGKPDFESVYAIDIALFNEQIITLIEGGEIVLPRYNFITGEREQGEVMRIKHNQPIIIEGIHGLNPELTRFIPDIIKYKIYVSALTQLNIDSHNRIKTTDVRLIRRMVRDAQFRGHSAQATLKMWSEVRRGEDMNIFPFQEQADVMFNSSLPYELAVLKDFACRLLEGVPKKSPEYLKAQELMFIVSMFESIDPYHTPKSSIIREFVGNSIFDY